MRTASYSGSSFKAQIQRETDRVELKTGVSQEKISATLVAFSNTRGGTIYIGVRDDRTVVGCKLDQGVDDKLHRAATTAHDVGRYEIDEIDVDGIVVVRLVVKRREEGFAQTSDGRILQRKGGQNVALIGAEAFDFMSSRALRRFERTGSGIQLDEVGHEALAEFCEVYGWSGEVDELPDRLLERGLLREGGELTIGGALVLTNPSKNLALKKCVVEVRRYDDNGPDYNRREFFSGTLPDQVRFASRFVSDELGSDLVVTGLYRYDIPRLPEVVVRETIANAVAHRSYETDRTAVLIEMRPDEIVVRSPGGLPAPVTIRTIREAQAARNPSVIDVLRRFSLAEDAGRGIDVIEDEMARAMLDPPAFEADETSVTVHLPLHGAITSRERAWVEDLERQGSLDNSDRLLLVHAARGELLTNGVARLIIGNVDSLHARRSLQRLRDAGLLLQHGERGGVTYTLAEGLAPPAIFRLSPKQLEALILEAAVGEPLTNSRVRKLTGLAPHQALAILGQLVDEGRLRREGARRGTTYLLP